MIKRIIIIVCCLATTTAAVATIIVKVNKKKEIVEPEPVVEVEIEPTTIEEDGIDDVGFSDTIDYKKNLQNHLEEKYPDQEFNIVGEEDDIGFDDEVEVVTPTKVEKQEEQKPSEQEQKKPKEEKQTDVTESVNNGAIEVEITSTSNQTETYYFTNKNTSD